MRKTVILSAALLPVTPPPALKAEIYEQGGSLVVSFFDHGVFSFGFSLGREQSIALGQTIVNAGWALK